MTAALYPLKRVKGTDVQVKYFLVRSTWWQLASEYSFCATQEDEGIPRLSADSLLPISSRIGLDTIEVSKWRMRSLEFARIACCILLSTNTMYREPCG